MRELEHAIEHGFVLCTGDVIDTAHIPSEIIRFNRHQDDGTDTYGVKTESEEKQELISILEKTDWNKAKAARLMGVSRPTLYRKLEKYGLEIPFPQRDLHLKSATGLNVTVETRKAKFDSDMD